MATNSRSERWHQRPLQVGLVVAVVSAIAASTSTWLLASRSSSAPSTETSPSALTTVEATTPQTPIADPFVGYLADGFWDSSGQREGIRVLDAQSPWADGATFNALVNAPFYDSALDTRQFVDAAVVGKSSDWSKDISVAPGDVVEAKALLINHADPELLADSPDDRGVARGTRLGFSVGSYTSGSINLFAVVGATNTDPRWIAARVIVRSDGPVALRPIANSARIIRRGESIALADSELFWSFEPGEAREVAARGTLIGTTNLDGIVELSSTVEVVVRFEVIA